MVRRAQGFHPSLHAAQSKTGHCHCWRRKGAKGGTERSAEGPHCAAQRLPPTRVFPAPDPAQTLGWRRPGKEDATV